MVPIAIFFINPPLKIVFSIPRIEHKNMTSNNHVPGRPESPVLRGGAEQFMDEAERSLHDAIMVVPRPSRWTHTPPHIYFQPGGTRFHTYSPPTHTDNPTGSQRPHWPPANLPANDCTHTCASCYRKPTRSTLTQVITDTCTAPPTLCLIP